MSEWMTMDTAPTDGREILLYSLGDIGVCYWRSDNVMEGWTWGLDKAFLMPTYWMPLPEPPNERRERLEEACAKVFDWKE